MGRVALTEVDGVCPICDQILPQLLAGRFSQQQGMDVGAQTASKIARLANELEVAFLEFARPGKGNHPNVAIAVLLIDRLAQELFKK